MQVRTYHHRTGFNDEMHVFPTFEIDLQTQTYTIRRYGLIIGFSTKPNFLKHNHLHNQNPSYKL